jgi:RsmE family RNA methyltransferase
VNLVLITEPEVSAGLPLVDPRSTHLLGTVGLRVGQTFHVGIAGGLRGLATVTATSPALRFDVVWEKSVQPRLPLTVLIGLPRPQTAKKVLHDLASLGAARLIFFEADKGDPGYVSSSLWKDGEYLEHLRKGTEQACSTLVPEVVRVTSLAEALAPLPAEGWKVALDPYEATGALGESAPAAARDGFLAIGPERGWSDQERAQLRNKGFALHHLGDRILRVEAACLVGGALMLAQLRAWQAHRALG